jgi:hypothetical protein
MAGRRGALRRCPTPPPCAHSMGSTLGTNVFILHVSRNVEGPRKIQQITGTLGSTQWGSCGGRVSLYLVLRLYAGACLDSHDTPASEPRLFVSGASHMAHRSARIGEKNGNEDDTTVAL